MDEVVWLSYIMGHGIYEGRDKAHRNSLDGL